MARTDHPFTDAAVEPAIRKWPSPVADNLMALRALILNTAAAHSDRIGPVIETLKWGQPSYLPKKPRIGTTVRIDGLKDPEGAYAMFFHCQTSLIETFRQLYPAQFIFEKNRALIFGPDMPPPPDETRHCILMALTYHLSSS